MFFFKVLKTLIKEIAPRSGEKILAEGGGKYWIKISSVFALGSELRGGRQGGPGPLVGEPGGAGPPWLGQDESKSMVF